MVKEIYLLDQIKIILEDVSSKVRRAPNQELERFRAKILILGSSSLAPRQEGDHLEKRKTHLDAEKRFNTRSTTRSHPERTSIYGNEDTKHHSSSWTWPITPILFVLKVPKRPLNHTFFLPSLKWSSLCLSRWRRRQEQKASGRRRDWRMERTRLRCSWWNAEGKVLHWRSSSCRGVWSGQTSSIGANPTKMARIPVKEDDPRNDASYDRENEEIWTRLMSFSESLGRTNSDAFLWRRKRWGCIIKRMN